MLSLIAIRAGAVREDKDFSGDVLAKTANAQNSLADPSADAQR